MSKILIAEDDNILAKAINTALKEHGYDTVVAVDGVDTMKKLRSFKPDLVMLDLLMPKMNGEEVLAEIRRDENLKDMPVLISTVKSDQESIARCATLGIRGYFIKAHYTLEDIVKEVKKALAE